jgi:hypothetical protein
MGVGFLFLFLAGCEAVFTFSPLALIPGVRRSIEDLPPEQQVAYAESLLSSGASAEDCAAAYAAIAAIAGTDPRLNLLAADLALGASGLNTAINTMIAQVGSGEFDFSTIEEIVSGDDFVTNIQNAGEHILTALETDPEADVSRTQYIVAGAALVFSAIEAEGLDPSDPDLDLETELAGNDDFSTAQDFFAAAGFDLENLTRFL